MLHEQDFNLLIQYTVCHNVWSAGHNKFACPDYITRPTQKWIGGQQRAGLSMNQTNNSNGRTWIMFSDVIADSRKFQEITSRPDHAQQLRPVVFVQY